MNICHRPGFLNEFRDKLEPFLEPFATTTINYDRIIDTWGNFSVFMYDNMSEFKEWMLVTNYRTFVLSNAEALCVMLCLVVLFVCYFVAGMNLQRKSTLSDIMENLEERPKLDFSDNVDNKTSEQLIFETLTLYCDLTYRLDVLRNITRHNRGVVYKLVNDTKDIQSDILNRLMTLKLKNEDDTKELISAKQRFVKSMSVIDNMKREKE